MVEILQQETQEKLEKLQDKMEEHNDHIDNKLGQVQSQVNNNKEKIEEIQCRELINIREELEILRNRLINYTHTHTYHRRKPRDNQLQRLPPVSYTHLDVYKRQNIMILMY